MNLPTYLGLLEHAECTLAEAFRSVADAHQSEPDVHLLARKMSGQCDDRAARLRPMIERYGEREDQEPERMLMGQFSRERHGGLSLLRDLHDLYVMAHFVAITWTMVLQAAQGLRDKELLQAAEASVAETTGQIRWLRTRMNAAAPQALLVAR
ncbi:hypothetical protein [Streptomyces sp. NPDC051776]|uniref:hypothetical protein n=1 Tax=Streptomyces sp. NPDC051776 TaxID=3155414 RepID=UPI00342C8F51